MRKLRSKRFCLLVALAMVTALWLAVAAGGRPGGGQTHTSSSSSSRSSSSSSSSSGSHSSGSSSTHSSGSSGNYGGTTSTSNSSGSSGGIGALVGMVLFMFFIFAIIIVLVIVMKARKGGMAPTAAPVEPDTSANLEEELAALRRADPYFSLPLFMDFVNALYAKAHEARGAGKIDSLAPYIDEAAIGHLRSIGTPETGLKDVDGIVLGTSKITSVMNAAEGTTITVFLEANYTEIAQNGQQVSYYTEERWHFWRQTGVTSLPPGKIDAIHCPKCGGPLEQTGDGACVYCNTVVRGGQFHWFVTWIEMLDRVTRGPQLTEYTPEEGTDLPTVYQPTFNEARAAFEAANQGFSWEKMNERVNFVFNSISQAWTTLEWEKARPFETDNIFQMHRYWIEAYKRQGLRNVLDQIQVRNIEWVKVDQDAFYDSLTARIWASELDFTVDQSGRVVCGYPNVPRQFTEYWTFIHTRGAKPVEHRNDNCPNCGGPLQVNMAGICEYCGGKVTSGDFDWVLSRIDQDESYTG